MLILAIRTDKPESELYLLELLHPGKIVGSEVWSAHRTLAETLHGKIKSLLASRHSTFHDLEGVIVYSGPGSFTGLRIGVAVSNALASSLDIPVVGSTSDDWIELGLKLLPSAVEQKSTVVIPQYGSDPHITVPRK